MLDVRHHLSFCRSVRAQLVGDHALWRDALLLQEARQQSLRGLGIAAGLHDLVEHIPVLIDGAPQPMLLAGDRDGHLVEVPNIVAACLLAVQAASIAGPEFLGPAADRFVGDHDASLQQHFLDQAQAQRKPEIKPDCMGDDLRRETMALVADGCGLHAIRIYAANPD